MKRKIEQITINSDSEPDTDDESIAHNKKGKAKAPPTCKTQARRAVIEISSDEDDDDRPRHRPRPTGSGSSSPHNHNNSASPPQLISKQEAFQTVLSIIPDVDLAHLGSLLDQQHAQPGTVAQGRLGYDVATIVDSLLTKGNYPKEGQKERELAAQAERDAKIDWLDLTWRGDGKSMPVQYKEQA